MLIVLLVLYLLFLQKKFCCLMITGWLFAVYFFVILTCFYLVEYKVYCFIFHPHCLDI